MLVKGQTPNQCSRIESPKIDKYGPWFVLQKHKASGWRKVSVANTRCYRCISIVKRTEPHSPPPSLSKKNSQQRVLCGNSKDSQDPLTRLWEVRVYYSETYKMEMYRMGHLFPEKIWISLRKSVSESLSCVEQELPYWKEYWDWHEQILQRPVEDQCCEIPGEPAVLGKRAETSGPPHLVHPLLPSTPNTSSSPTRSWWVWGDQGVRSPES